MHRRARPTAKIDPVALAAVLVAAVVMGTLAIAVVVVVTAAEWKSSQTAAPPQLKQSGGQLQQPTHQSQVPVLLASKGDQGTAMDMPIAAWRECKRSTKSPAQFQWNPSACQQQPQTFQNQNPVSLSSKVA